MVADHQGCWYRRAGAVGKRSQMDAHGKTILITQLRERSFELTGLAKG